MTGLVLVAAALAVVGYAYVLYPGILALGWGWRRPAQPPPPPEWPEITIALPAHNEEHTIGDALTRILETDYPAERRHVVVISDASTDRTDDIVRSFAGRGVRLVRLPARGGKTAAENAAQGHLRGRIVVSTDASVRLHPHSLKPLIAAFQDPLVGVASGRDVSVGRSLDTNLGESGYVGYEMRVRDLETAAGGIVGASGCFYASRVELQQEKVPEALSRDFAAPLIARERGYRSVSVTAAVCYVPRAPSVRHEYRRKVRTMSRGLQTLFYKRRLLHPLRYGRFAWMLFSHKLARWLVPWAALLGAVGVALLARPRPVMLVLVAATVAVVGMALVAWLRPAARLPRAVSVAAFVFWGLVAGLHAWADALRGNVTPVWEPTRRDAPGPAIGAGRGSEPG